MEEHHRQIGSDLPAAHSMDTCWFAVDDEGQLALLDSREAGAVPEVWFEQGSRYALLGALEALGLPVVLPDAVIAAMSSRVRWRGDEAAGDYTPEQYYNLLVRPVHPRIRDLLPRARLLGTDGGVFAFVPGPVPSETVDRLLERGLIEGGWAWFELLPSSFGLYRYHHANRWENWTSGPYVRDALPARPLHLSDLPEALQQTAVRLPAVSFAADEALQPIELLPCRSWQRTWVGLDGEQHEID